MWRRLGDPKEHPPAAGKGLLTEPKTSEDDAEEGLTLHKRQTPNQPIKKPLNIRLTKVEPEPTTEPAKIPDPPRVLTQTTSNDKETSKSSTKKKSGKFGKQKSNQKMPYTRDEWDPKHFRLFVGNLGQDVTTDILHQAFEKYPSLSKSKVVADARTGATIGYGFVAFKDSADYLSGFQEMNGKFIGSKPIQLKKADANNKK